MIKIRVSLFNEVTSIKNPIRESDIQISDEKQAIDLYDGIKSYIDRKLRKELKTEKIRHE